MIRINLLPTKVAKKKRAPAEGQAFVVLLLLAIAIEVGVFYFWYDSVATESDAMNNAATKVQTQVQELNKVKAQVEQEEQQREVLAAQNRVIASIQDNIGRPGDLLRFLLFVLSDTEMHLSEGREALFKKKQGNRDGDGANDSSKPDWNRNWDPDSVWLVEITERSDGFIEFRGHARGQADFAEFNHRLNSGVLFDGRISGQELNIAEDEIIESEYREFKAIAKLNYKIRGSEAVPAQDGSKEAPGAGHTQPAATE